MFLRIVLSSCARSLCVALCPNGLAYMLPSLDPLKVYIAGVHADVKWYVVKGILHDKGHWPTVCFVTGEWPIGKPLQVLYDVSKHFGCASEVLCVLE